jgi:protein-arginine kinase activator protein McsA
MKYVLCSKCHEKVATVHLTVLMPGDAKAKADFCADCAPPGDEYSGFDPEKRKAFSVTGKKCEFCDREAVSGTIGVTGPIYWCKDCGKECMQIMAELSVSERADLMERYKEPGSYFTLMSDPEFIKFSEETGQKALTILRERRKRM